MITDKYYYLVKYCTLIFLDFLEISSYRTNIDTTQEQCVYMCVHSNLLIPLAFVFSYFNCRYKWDLWVMYIQISTKHL